MNRCEQCNMPLVSDCDVEWCPYCDPPSKTRRLMMNKCGHCGTMFRDVVFHCCAPQHFDLAAGPWQRDVENLELEPLAEYLLHDRGGYYAVGWYNSDTDVFVVNNKANCRRKQLIAVAKINRSNR